MRHSLFTLMGAAALAASLPANAQTMAEIGLASAAKNEVIVVDTNRGLKAGDNIFQNQHIRTGKDSAAQLLFRDETALTMGPNSSLVLDKAVYDPEKHTGEISVRAVSGAFRFISGSSPVGSYSINTPAGTVGIRGTWIEMLVFEGGIRLIVRRGLVNFCNQVSQCTRVLPGYEIRAFRDRIGAPTKVSHETVESVVALWFKDGSEANLGNLAPGAGPDDKSVGGPNQAGKPFWWLDSSNRGPDFQPQFSSLPGGPTGVTPPDTTPPPHGGPNPNRLQKKAFLFLVRVAIQLYRYIDAHTHNQWQLRKVKHAIRDEVRDLKQYVRQTLPNIDTKQELREFKREVRRQAREIRQEVRDAVKHHHHHRHRHYHKHFGNKT